MSESPCGEPSPDLVVVGRVLRPWGAHGDLRVHELTDRQDRFAPKSRVVVRGAAYVIERSRKAQRSIRLLKLEGVETLEAARGLQGAELEVPADELAPLPEGRYYHYHLVGLRVVSTAGEDLGELTEVMETGANDVFVVTRNGDEVLIPAVADVVKDVDLEAGVMTVELLPGLI